MRRSIRVAFISEHASPAALLGGQDAGGQNVYVDEVSRHLANLGYSVDIFTRRDSPAQAHIVYWAPGVRIINLNAGDPRPVPKDDLWPLMSAFYQDFLRFMVRDGVRYDILHGNFWMSGWVGLQLAKYLRIPTTQTFHALGMTKRKNQGVADTSPPGRIGIERQIVQQMTRLIAQCPHERSELIEDYNADPDKISLISPGVNADRFHPVEKERARKHVGAPLDQPLIVYVGRLLPRKDIRNIVRALAILKDGIDSGSRSLSQVPHLMVVGGESADPDPVLTPEIGELKSLASQLGVRDHVLFTGQEFPDDLRYYYSAADAVVSTPWYEPFGLTPLEAMACGRPVIGSHVGGLTFTIEEDRTGFLVPPRDPESLSDRLELLLSHPMIAESMGKRAHQRIQREFTWQVVAERIADMYDQLLPVSQTQKADSPLTTSPPRIVELGAAERYGGQLESD